MDENKVIPLEEEEEEKIKSPEEGENENLFEEEEQGEDAEAAAHSGNAQKCPFRDAPHIFSCVQLVNGHNQKACRIHNKEVNQNNLHKFILSGGKR